MFRTNMTLASFDPVLAKAIDGERTRQEEHVELIASENYASPRVLEAQGSVLTNKYAEGYPGKRYYGGCEYVDVVEQLAIDRAKQLFGAAYANVQPHSGSQANAAAYLALVQPGDPILGMSLDHGGHLTHGAKVNFSGKYFRAAQYGIRPDTGEIDYEQVQRLAEEHRPKLIIAGFSAYSRVIDWARFAAIAKSVGAYFVVDMAHVAGLVAARQTRLPDHLGRHGQSLVPHEPGRPRHHRQGRRRRTRSGQYHGKQERRAERPAPADGHERIAHRHAGIHDARLQGAGDRAGG